MTTDSKSIAGVYGVICAAFVAAAVSEVNPSFIVQFASFIAGGIVFTYLLVGIGR